jgi:hypothetical protein
MVNSRRSCRGGLGQSILATRRNRRSPRCSHVSISADASAALTTFLNRVKKSSIGANVRFASCSRKSCCARSSCLSRAASSTFHFCFRTRMGECSSSIAPTPDVRSVDKVPIPYLQDTTSPCTRCRAPLPRRQLMPSHAQDRSRIRESRTYGLDGRRSAMSVPTAILHFVAMRLVRCWQILLRSGFSF